MWVFGAASAVACAIGIALIGLFTSDSVEPLTRTFVIAGAIAVGALESRRAARAREGSRLRLGVMTFGGAWLAAILGGNEHLTEGASFLGDLFAMVAGSLWIALPAGVTLGFVAMAMWTPPINARGVKPAAKGGASLGAGVAALAAGFFLGPLASRGMFEATPHGSSGRGLAVSSLVRVSRAQEEYWAGFGRYANEVDDLGPDAMSGVTRTGMHVTPAFVRIDSADSATWTAQAMSGLGNWTCRVTYHRADKQSELPEPQCTRSRSWFARYGKPAARLHVLPRTLVVGDSVSVTATVSPGGSPLTGLTAEVKFRASDTTMLAVVPRMHQAWDRFTSGDLFALREGESWLVGTFTWHGETISDSIRIAIEPNVHAPLAPPWVSVASGDSVALDTSSIARIEGGAVAFVYRARSHVASFTGAIRHNTVLARTAVKCNADEYGSYPPGYAMNDGPVRYAWAYETDPDPRPDWHRPMPKSLWPLAERVCTMVARGR